MRWVPGVGPGAVGVGTHTHTGKTPRQHREQKAATCRPRGEPEESAGGDGHGGRASGLWAEGGAAAASQADILVVAPSLPCVSFTFSVCGSVKLSLYGSRVVIFKNLDLQGLCHPGVMKMPVRRPARRHVARGAAAAVVSGTPFASSFPCDSAVVALALSGGARCPHFTRTQMLKSYRMFNMGRYW